MGYLTETKVVTSWLQEKVLLNVEMGAEEEELQRGIVSSKENPQTIKAETGRGILFNVLTHGITISVSADGPR